MMSASSPFKGSNIDQIDAVPTGSEVSTSPIYGLHLSRLGSKKSSPTKCIQLIDILPSYQMHQSIMNRPNNRNNQDISLLPTYSSESIGEGIGTVLDEPVVGDTSKDSILDNIHLLPTIRDRDIRIKIKVDNQKQEFFSSGDTINGVVEIENTSNKERDFELFFISLEGNSRVSTSDFAVHQDEYKMRTFLRMVDLGGSWTESDRETRLSDKLYLNLPHDRKLLPHTTYQKIFRFKIPEDALGISCVHNIQAHFHLPPSIGLNSILYPPKGLEYNDEERNRFRYKDLSMMSFSINYSIDVRLIKTSELTRSHILTSASRFLFRLIPSRKEPQQFVLSPDRSLVLLERVISNDIRHATNEETDPDQLKLQNLYCPYRNPQLLNYYLTGKFSNSFKLVMNIEENKNHNNQPVTEKVAATGPTTNNLTFSTNSTASLDFNRLSNPMIHNSKNYNVQLNVDLFYQLQRPEFQNVQQSYRSTTKLDFIVPTEISAELHYVNVHAKGLPIPIELNPLWFTSKYIFQQKIWKKFKELNDRVRELPQDAQLYATTLQLIKAMESLSCEDEILPNVVKVDLIEKGTTEIVENEFLDESYKTSLNIRLSIDNKKLRSTLLVPDYQECLSSRFYYIRLKFKGTKYFNSNFSVHYNAVNGDIIDKLGDKRYKFYLDIPLKIEKF